MSVYCSFAAFIEDFLYFVFNCYILTRLLCLIWVIMIYQWVRFFSLTMCSFLLNYTGPTRCRLSWNLVFIGVRFNHLKLGFRVFRGSIWSFIRRVLKGDFYLITPVWTHRGFEAWVKILVVFNSCDCYYWCLCDAWSQQLASNFKITYSLFHHSSSERLLKDSWVLNWFLKFFFINSRLKSLNHQWVNIFLCFLLNLLIVLPSSQFSYIPHEIWLL
jgi:hypothetical protein